MGKAIWGFKSNLEFWGTLPLSVAGRVALLKMVTLPRLLYYFRTLPVWIPASIFKQLQSMITGFLWAAGRRRVALKILIRPKSEGGLAVPDLETFYLAAQLQWLTQAVALEFRGPGEQNGGQTPGQVLSRIILQLLQCLKSLSNELRTFRLCWDRSQRSAQIALPYAPEFPLAMCTTLPDGGNWTALTA